MKSLLVLTVLLAAQFASADLAQVVCEDNLEKRNGSKYYEVSEDVNLAITKLNRTLAKLNVKATPSLTMMKDEKTSIVQACAIVITQ